MQSQEGNGRVDGFSGFGAQTNHFETGAVDLLGQLIHCDVGRGAHEDWARSQLSQVINNRGRGDGLAGAGRSLNQCERTLNRLLHCKHLQEKTPVTLALNQN